MVQERFSDKDPDVSSSWNPVRLDFLDLKGPEKHRPLLIWPGNLSCQHWGASWVCLDKAKHQESTPFEGLEGVDVIALGTVISAEPQLPLCRICWIIGLGKIFFRTAFP